MKFLLITILLGVAIAACGAWTVDDVKDKLNGIKDYTQQINMPAHDPWDIVYSPEDGVAADGVLSVGNVHVSSLTDIKVLGDVIDLGKNKFQFTLYANCKYDLNYYLNITDLMFNNGTVFGEINEFTPVIVVEIEDNGNLQLDDVISVTVGSVPLIFLHSTFTKAHDVIFNNLQGTFRSLVLSEINRMYAPLVLVKILALANKT